MTKKPEVLTAASLTRRLVDRLAELEAEQSAIDRALTVLDRAPTGQPTLTDRILGALNDEPGARASMMAMMLSLPPDAVTDELRRLEASGSVERWRLGWRSTSIGS